MILNIDFPLWFIQVTHFLNNEAKGTKVIGATSLSDMVGKLKTPRKIMLLVKGKNFYRPKLII